MGVMGVVGMRASVSLVLDVQYAVVLAFVGAAPVRGLLPQNSYSTKPNGTNGLKPDDECHGD